MKKTTFLKVILLAFIFLQSFISYSQTLKPFTPRFDKDIKGDMLLIGNSILNRADPNTAYNGNKLNSDFDMQFINIDNGATAGVFNSSSANLVVPNASAPAAPCYKILYAALYWGAVTKGTTPITNIKFKMPTGGYNDVVGTIIHDSGTNVIGTSYPYACYADVTSLVTGAGNPTPEGTYTVANVSTKVGTNGGTGLSAGWSLFIVYEDPKLAAKSITSFDGFSAISSTVNLDIPVTGFRTIPTGPVRAKFAFSALEGDQGISGDYLTINGSILSAVNNAGTTIRGTNNFFNSSVTYIDPANGKTENFINRNPASTNTLGYDAGILEINNNGNAVIKNNDISAVIGLRSNQDVYFYYFNAISLEIIEPKIVLTKQVFSDATLTTNIGNANVTLGQELFYAIGFQNIGNDDAENFTIKDILPININFDPNNIIVPNGSGITYVYNAATRTIVFTIPSNLVEKSDPRYIIKFKVQVVPECNDLSDACSDKIQNQAFATYVGVTSDIKVDDQLSLSTFGECYLGTASPTNFLVGVENCIYTKDYQLCGASVVLTAANGYNSYSWSTSATGTPVIGTTQSITVSQTGTYYVNNIANAPCRSIKQVVTVSPSGTTVQNPVIPFADQVVQCPNNGKDLPKIFLCGANATRLINTGVTDAISIVWQKLNEASCTAIGTDDCANEKVDCTWDNIATGSSYTANTSGQFRVVFNYAGGCFNIFYFNVFKNLLNPTATSRDIICNTSGEIIVGGVPTSGYEFSLSASGPFQDSNVFSITTASTYTVYIRQKGIVSNPCLFSVPGIDILQRNFTVSEFISQPLCNGDKGSIKLAANDVRAQYFYSISKSGSLVNAVGPIAASDHTFSNLSPGSYDYEVKTDDGCLKTGTIVLIEPDVLKATVNQTKALTCETGEITVYPIGGTAPYAYYVNGSTTAQYSAVVNTPTAGNYTIRVVDYNGCIANTSITIAAVPKPVYNPTGTNVNCYGDSTGVINFNVTNANGYTLAYSINNGTTYGSSAIISNLAAGTYNTILKYSLNGVECLDTMKVITITQPATALTASAGVSELAGCGPAREGKVRITNPQGGVAPYEYSFDNQATWINVNDAYKAPGTYTLYIRDANGCIYAMPNIIIEPEPVAPVINVDTPVDFNCDGTATSTVTINNPGGTSYTYDYYLDGVKNTNVPSNVFINVTPGTHAVRVEYKVGTVPTFSNLLKEDFGIGEDVTSPGMNSAYCFERQVTATQCRSSIQINDGDYSVTARIVSPFGPWVAARDHTSNATVAKGRFLAVNIGGFAGADGVLYSKPIKDIIQNQPVSVSVYAMNLLELANSQEDPELLFQLVNGAGVVIASQSTNKIPKTVKKTNPDWINYSLTLNPLNNTNLNFVIRSKSIATSGNDVVIDDINVFQLPKSCITTKDFTVVVPTGKAFTAQIAGTKNVTCNGLTNGEITISATNIDATKGFQYSIDNGTTWSVALFTSPVTISNLAGALYKVIVRPVGSSVASCSKPFDVTISTPTAVTATASITTLATCTTGATITAVGGGGTPAYQYALYQSDGTTVITGFNNNANFTNVPAGSYTVFVRDANGCTNPVGIVVNVTAPPALTASLATTTDYCYTTANPATLGVTVTGGTGPFTYKLDGNAAVSSASTSYSFTNVAPGTHDIVVTDSNNCTDTISSIVIAPQIVFNVSLINDLTCSDDASIGNEVVTNGNGGSYTYTVSYNSGTPATVTSFPYTATQAGNYVFTVTDSRGCPATSNIITVTPKTTPSHSTVKTDITCNGLSNGTITVTASGGFTSVYTYVLSGPIPTTTQTTNQFTNLPAGDYTVSITDSKGCTSLPTTVTIANPTPIAPNATATAFTCSPTNAPQSATITVAPTGGSGTYTYSYNNGATFGSNATLTVNDNGLTQTINVVVKDANGCLSTMQAIVLAPLNRPVIDKITSTLIYCAPSATTSTATIAMTPGTGVAPLAYTIVSGPTTNISGASTGEFTGLAAGNYVFRATDANGCYDTESHTIAPGIPIVATGTKLTDVNCFNGTTGSIRYSVSGFGTGTYSYIVNAEPPVTGQTLGTFDLTNRPAGTYTVVFTDDITSCTATTIVTINQPTAALDITLVSNINANCNVPTARVTVAASGGTTAYAYAFVPVGNIPAATDYTASPVRNLNPATPVWDVYVRDANGCTDMVQVTITSDPIPTVTATGSGCLGTAGGYTITAANTTTPLAGIITPIRYSINNGASYQTSNVFTVTTAGTYIITMIDGNGCIATALSVVVAPQLTLNAVLNKDITCVVGDEPARITVTPTGGSGTFTYAITTPLAEASNVTGATTGIFTTNTAGNYTFTVTDNTTGCAYTTTTAITVTAPIIPDITGITQTAFINCNGDDTGAIRADFDVSLGLAPFQFSIDGINYQSSNTFTGLSAGPYTITIRDAKGCTDTDGITITEPRPMVIDYRVIDIQCVSGSGISKGSIIIDMITDGVSTVGGSGGTAPYTYYVTGINGYNQFETNPGNISTSFDVVDFGFYQIRVVDANGCTVIENDVKVASDPDDLDIVINTTADCTLGGTANVAVLGALTSSGPFHFNIYRGAFPPQIWTADGVDGWQGEAPPTSKGTTFTGLLPGVTYTFIVYDEATLCYYYETAATIVPTNTQLTVDNVVGNNIKCTGDTNGSVNFNINNTYTSSVTVSYQVYEAFTNVLITGANGTGTIPAGGTLPITNFGVSLLPAGSYYILVRETAGPNVGCSIASINFNILESPVILTVTGTIIKNSNCTDNGIITALAENGTGPYTYQVTASAIPPLAADTNWVLGNTFNRPGSLTGITYYVYAKDAYGCIQSDDVILLQDAPPTIALPATICYNGTPFTINLVTDAAASATILPATYSVNGSAFQASPSFTFNAAGTYNLVIKDGNGCTDDVDYIVLPQLQLTPALTKVLDCNLPAPNATVTVTATGGAGAGSYTYMITSGPVVNTTGVTSGIFTGLDAGTYIFETNDGACTASTTFVIDPIPATVLATPIVKNVSCNAGTDGEITINVTSGVGPYKYSLFDGVTSTPFQTANTFANLSAGTTYTVTVRNDRDCLETTVPITVSEPALLAATAAAAPNTTCSNTTVITVTASGGTQTGVGTGYTYNFNGLGYTSDNTFTVNNGPVATTTTISVRDANGCIVNLTDVTTPALIPPTNLTFVPTILPTCPANSETVEVRATNGVGALVFEIIEFNNAPTILYPSQTTAGNTVPASFTGLPPGDYMFEVTDSNGCTYQELYTVNPVTNITVAASGTTDVTCFAANNGTATFTVTNFTSYTAILTLGSGTPVIAGNTVSLISLAPGNYTLQVTDSTTGCIDDVSFTITEPTLALDFTTVATNINCNVDTATITVTPVGGTSNYKYAVVANMATAPTTYVSSNQLTVDTSSGLDMVWDVYVMDANGCVDVETVTIQTDASPTIASAVATQCPSSTGTYDITVTATGFSPTTFQYSADGSNYQTGNIITVNAPGNYTITVKDANGCPSIGVAVTIYEPLILSPIVDTPVSCANNDGIITVSTTGGSNSLSNYQYKIDAGTYPMATPFAGLAFGLHRVYVQDIATGCEVYVDIDLQEATPITGFALAKTEVTCNGGTDGTITASMDTPADGVNDNPIYTYVLSGTTTVTSTAVNRGPQDSPLFSGLEAGTYTVTVTSERGCTDNASITIVEPGLIFVPAPTIVPFGCTTDNIGNLATITVDPALVTGGSNIYMNYEFIKVGTTTNTQVQFGASNVYTEADLTGGSYIVNVYDDKGCIGTTTAAITIDPYIALDKVNVVIDQAITCNNLENITVSATIIGVGTPNLEYTLVDVIYDPITGVSTTGTIYPAIPNNNGIFTGLPVGNYLITVKNLDTNCEIQGVHYVNEPNTFDLTIDTVVDVTCFSGTDGSVNVTFVDRLITTTPVNGDDAGAFTYTLQDALGNTLPGGTALDAGPITISGLATGTYTITATLSQSPSCPVIKNFTITGPTAALDITETHTEITCVTGNNDGTISVTATGGWLGAYEFELVGPTPAQNIAYSAQTEFTGLTAGTYTINVRDSKGCEDFVTITLADPAPIVFTATPSTTLVSCFGDTNASITVTTLPTGGSGNYLYSLVTTYTNGTVTTDGPQVSNTFTNLGAGNYQVQVSDSWTCSALSAAILITEPAKVTASLALATAISCDVDATLTLTASGGTAPYEYSTTSTFGTVIAMTGNTATFSVPVGTYNYYIRDINGCESFISNDITIDTVPALVIDVNIQNAVINCKGDDSGVIVATAQGGLGNYVYTLLDGAGNALSFTPVQTSPGNFTNLPAGSYLVNVVSMDCEARTVVPVVITEPDFPLTESNAVTNITCAGEGDGKIVITASGGTGIIKYAISPDLNQFFESNVFDNLKPGTYDYIVQDENGCFIYTTGVIISEPNSIFVTTIPGTEIPEVCAGDADGAFSINVTGGNAPYSVSLDDVNGTYTPGTLVQTQFDFTGLSGSEHIVYVRDANNCTTEHTVILGEAVTLNPQATLNYDCVSNSASNSVTVTVDASNMPADLDYALDGSTVFQASNVFTDLTPGRHTIDVRHSNGCIKQVVFDVLQVDPLTLTLADGGLNEIVATATGGGGNYQYTLDGESYGNQSNFIIYKSGDYTVTVTDINGCTATATRYFEFIDIKIPNVFTPNGDGNNDTWAPTNTINYKDLVFYVYDRYGRKLGSYRESQFWDGKYNGNELPSGDYWYVIKIRDAKDAREFVGHFTLYR
ncbi:gliding motility-associated-like protein [Flavobacterium limicola]|uniref:Gliding motility-associated-like protein n=1 Tax=Flavobacterium limicola TaxID=180441 RepID=A0A495S5A6_9FLAO|nr:T9SS type B sorting domain-containing protein [Flavobacterium limicola]RKS94781.1 gliding motility-associated-like protein [Flavobacterium limicola]